MKRALLLFLLSVLVLSCLTACLPSADSGRGTSGGDAPSVSEKPSLSEQIAEPTVHGAISPDAYIQYATLSLSEKAAYDRLREGVLGGINNVDVSDLNIPRDRANYITRKFVADNPQFFYLSRTIGYIYNPETNLVNTYQLLYTDGITVDRFDGSEFAEKANRSTINEQIRQFNEKVRQVVSSVPSTLSAAEKAKVLHDYIVANTSYDQEAAEYTSAKEPMPRAYDAFGALFSGKAICEGYSKLYQYLCYCVGINGTQIVGSAEGTPHMWNALLLDGVWYLTDVTWDDPRGNEQNLPVYDYYNLTSAEIAKTHVADESVLTVPKATDESLSFRKVYGVERDASGNWINYRAALDRLAATGEKYLHLYNENLSEDLAEFLGTHVFSDDSVFVKYIREKGYDLSFNNTFVISGNYVYLVLK